MRRVTCTCGWSELAFTRRGAQLKQDLHDTTCSKPGIDDSGLRFQNELDVRDTSRAYKHDSSDDRK